MPAKILPSLTILQALRAEQGGWVSLAACRGMDPDLFFPITGRGNSNNVEVNLAKQVSRSAPCRRHAWTMRLRSTRCGVVSGVAQHPGNVAASVSCGADPAHLEPHQGTFASVSGLPRPPDSGCIPIGPG